MRRPSWVIASPLLFAEEQEAPRVEQRCGTFFFHPSTKKQHETLMCETAGCVNLDSTASAACSGGGGGWMNTVVVYELGN